MRQRLIICLLTALLAGPVAGLAQSVDSLADKLTSFPSRLFARIQGKTAGLDRQLTRQTEKYLERMARREQRLKKKLSRVDSAAANHLFANADGQYAAMLQKFKRDTSAAKLTSYSGEYQAYTDSLRTSLAFLQQSPQLLAAMGKNAGALQSQLQSSSGQLQQLQGKLQSTDDIKAFVQQRKDQIKEYLSRYTQLPAGLSKEYQGISQDMYYYSSQVREYKEMLNDPDKMEKQALALLSKTRAFQTFMTNNSQLASLFGLPGNAGNAGTPQALAGLQTRDQLQQMVQGQLAGGGPNALQALQDNMQSGASQLDALKDKLNKYGSDGGTIESPDFKPNNQRTKSLFKRLEWGSNLQTAQSSNFFPITTDLGFSLAYKLNNTNSVSIGASGKIGWGKDIQHIAFTWQGIGLRSGLDIKLKGSFFISGGFEYNHQTPFTNLQSVRHLDDWTKSGLIGISKTVSIKSKFFKKTKLQVLWDFLSYQQVPKTQPFVFRAGYVFN
ncbi:MAG TPA: hypothetical protein VL832_24645 [Puia sp.]|nr:hypothetical protein [Puia sp.]